MADDLTRFAGRTSRRRHWKMSSRAKGAERDFSNYIKTSPGGSWDVTGLILRRVMNNADDAISVLSPKIE